MCPDIFEEAVKTEVKPKNKDIERMLIGMFTGNYTRSTPEEMPCSSSPCGDKAKSALAKKLKGAKFETDRDNLMKIGGFSEQDAGDYAYLYAEAAVWQTFRSVAGMSRRRRSTAAPLYQSRRCGGQFHQDRGDLMATKEQIRRIYALSAAAGLLDRSAGNDDNLHLWVKQFSLKDHISELTEQPADFIIRRLEEYRSQVAPKPELITEEQQNMCFKLMYRIAEISPSDIKPRERLRGVISKVTGREIRPDRDIFSRVTRAEGSEIIEMLKRILRSEQNKLKRSDKHGTCNAGKEEPP